MRTWLVIGALMLAGCGVSGKTPVGELTGEDMVSLCGEEDEGSFTCTYEGGEYTETFGTECEAMATGFSNPFTADCSATAADYRICRQAFRSLLDDDPCASLPEVECAFMLDCQISGS